MFRFFLTFIRCHRGHRRRHAQALLPWSCVALLLAAWPWLAQGQPVFNCTTSGGQGYTQDKPCPPAHKVQQYSPADPRPPSPEPGPPRAPEALPHHALLPSAACKDLSEALRTAVARGLGAEGVQNLNKEWRQRCLEEDAIARQRHEEQQQAERRQRDDKLRRADALAAQARADLQARRDRCAEMSRILAKRRERTDLSDGEQTDLQRFETSYRERCSGS